MNSDILKRLEEIEKQAQKIGRLVNTLATADLTDEAVKSTLETLYRTEFQNLGSMIYNAREFGFTNSEVFDRIFPGVK